MFELGCSTIVYRKMNLEGALREIKSQRFDIVDIGTVPHFCPHFDPLTATEADKARLKELLREMRLRISTLNGNRGFWNDPNERDDQIEFTRRSLDLAEYLGAYAVTVQSGAPVSPHKWLDTAKKVAKDFVELAAYAKDKGQDLTVEIHKQMFIETPKQAIDFLDLVDRKNVGIAFDPAHLIWSGVDPVEAVSQMKDLIKHVHLKDARDKDIHYTVGDGIVNFWELIQGLKQIHYARALVLEIEPLSEHLQDINREVKRSRDYLTQLLKE